MVSSIAHHLGLSAIAWIVLISGQPAHAEPNQAQPSPSPGLTQTLPLPADVSPDHWAYQAVLNLTANYGCLVGYPDGTFRGDQPVTRYEFAAAMNACLENLAVLLNEQQSENQAAAEALIQSMQDMLGELRDLEARTDAL